MVYFLYTLFFLSCVSLIGSVLLQPGKTDAGALFTSSVSSNAFGPRGTATVLSKVTIVAATCFMLSALLLAMPALTGDVSVLSTTSDTTTEQPANTDANTANTNVDANVTNANVAVDTNVAPTNTNVANTTNTNVANTKVVTNTANKAINTNVAKTNAAKNTK